MMYWKLTILFSLANPVLARVALRVPNGTAYEDCQQNCTTAKLQMQCEHCNPQNISEKVKEVILTQLSADQLVAHGFCNTSWENVRSLTIVSDYIYDIKNYSFDCLYKVATLKLSLPNLVLIYSNSFYGLINIKVLDFIGCVRLRTPFLAAGFSLGTIVPNLTTLTLNNMGTVTESEGVELSQSFIDTIALRNVSELNIVSTRVKFEDASMEQLCTHLKLLNLSNSVIDTSKIQKSQCYSLETVDFHGAKFSETIFPMANFTLPKGMKITLNDDWMYFFSSVSVLFLDRLPFHFHIYIKESTLTVLFNNSIEEIHISGYHLHVFEVQIIFRPNKLKYLDLSDNEIERLSPKAFTNLEYLEKLDLSKNKLGLRNELKDVSPVLLRNNSRLEYVSLADNRLKELPLHLFHMNKRLKKLDVARNEITQLNIDVSKLAALESIDLRNNSIRYLDQRSRGQIEKLLENQKKQGKNLNGTKIIVDLRGNPFSCKCDSLDFLHWFVGSPIFDNTRDQYRCEIDGLNLPMNAEAIDMAQTDCDKLKTMLLFISISVISLGLLVVVMAIVFKKFKERRTKQRFTDIISLIQENKTGYRFLVFLSFASKYDTFVLTNVFQPLKETLKTTTQTERDLVAIGDLKFKVGRSIFSEAVELLEDCAVVVVVLSKNYCESDYCKMEIEQARLMNKPIVIILQGNVSENDMNTVIKSVFHHFTRVTFQSEDGTYRLQQDWRFICQSIISVAADTCIEKNKSGSVLQLAYRQCCVRRFDENISTRSTGDRYVVRYDTEQIS